MPDFDIETSVVKRPKKSYHCGLWGRIAFNPAVNAQELLFLGILVDRSKVRGHCWASNASLADMVEKTPRTIRNYISKLEKLGYIQVENKHVSLFHSERKIFVNPDVLRDNRVVITQESEHKWYPKEEYTNLNNRKALQRTQRDFRNAQVKNRRKTSSWKKEVERREFAKPYSTNVSLGGGGKKLPPNGCFINKTPNPGPSASGDKVSAGASFSEQDSNVVSQNRINPMKKIGQVISINLATPELKAELVGLLENNLNHAEDYAIVGTDQELRRDFAEHIDTRLSLTPFGARQDAQRPRVAQSIERDAAAVGFLSIAFGYTPDELSDDPKFLQRIGRLSRDGKLGHVSQQKDFFGSLAEKDPVNRWEMRWEIMDKWNKYIGSSEAHEVKKEWAARAFAAAKRVVYATPRSEVAFKDATAAATSAKGADQAKAKTVEFWDCVTHESLSRKSRGDEDSHMRLTYACVQATVTCPTDVARVLVDEAFRVYGKPTIAKAVMGDQFVRDMWFQGKGTFDQMFQEDTSYFTDLYRDLLLETGRNVKLAEQILNEKFSDYLAV